MKLEIGSYLQRKLLAKFGPDNKFSATSADEALLAERVFHRELNKLTGLSIKSCIITDGTTLFDVILSCINDNKISVTCRKYIISLINSRVGVDCQNYHGDTPLVYAIKYSVLHDFVGPLIDAGATLNRSPNPNDKLSMTPLGYALRNGYAELVKLLINRKVDVGQVTDDRNMKPLEYVQDMLRGRKSMGEDDELNKGLRSCERILKEYCAKT